MTLTQEPPETPAGPLAPILATVIWLVIAVLAFVPTLMSVMMFDSGTDNVPISAWLFFYGLWAFLGTCVLTVPIAWVAWGVTRKRGRGGRLIRVIAALLPIIPLAISAGGAIALSLGPCNGSFNC